MEVFKYGEKDYIHQFQTINGHDYQLSEFDKLVHRKWNEAMEKGYIRYNLDGIKSRVVPGKYGYYVQLNTKRGHDRRKPEYISTLKMPFDPTRFNFSKVRDGEIICEFYSQDTSAGKATPSRNIIIVNASPLEFGHILLVPEVDKGIPQRLTEHGVRYCLDMMMLSSHPCFRVGFNSLCALASVNHQHVHAWYLDQNIYSERAPVLCLHEDIVYETTDMPVNAFVFQLHQTTVGTLAQRVFKVLNLLQESDVAHNMFITRGQVFGASAGQPNSTVRVYIFARKKTIGAIFGKDHVPLFAEACIELAGYVPIYGAIFGPDKWPIFAEACAELGGHIPLYGMKNEVVSVFNVAVAELGGHIPSYGVKNESEEPFNLATAEFGFQLPMFVPEMYDVITEQDIVDRIAPHALEQDELERIRNNIKLLFS